MTVWRQTLGQVQQRCMSSLVSLLFGHCPDLLISLSSLQPSSPTKVPRRMQGTTWGLLKGTYSILQKSRKERKTKSSTFHRHGLLSWISQLTGRKWQWRSLMRLRETRIGTSLMMIKCRFFRGRSWCPWMEEERTRVLTSYSIRARLLDELLEMGLDIISDDRYRQWSIGKRQVAQNCYLEWQAILTEYPSFSQYWCWERNNTLLHEMWQRTFAQRVELYLQSQTPRSFVQIADPPRLVVF